MTIQREQLEADVLIVARGGGLACALHLANLIKKHNASGAKPELSTEDITCWKKTRDWRSPAFRRNHEPESAGGVGSRFEKSAPLDTPVTDDAALLFTKGSSFRFPITRHRSGTKAITSCR